MNLQHLIYTVTQYLSWLYNRQWERWELAVAAIAILALMILLFRARQKVKANARFYRERSPIIGIDLDRRKRWRRKLEPSQKSRPTESKRAKERLQHDPAEGSRTSEHLDQKLTALTAVNRQLQQELIKSIQAQKRLKQEVTELTAANAQIRHRRREQERSEQGPVERSEAGSDSRKQKLPLNIKELGTEAPRVEPGTRIDIIAGDTKGM